MLPVAPLVAVGVSAVATIGAASTVIVTSADAQLAGFSISHIS